MQNDQFSFAEIYIAHTWVGIQPTNTSRYSERSIIRTYALPSFNLAQSHHQHHTEHSQSGQRHPRHHPSSGRCATPRLISRGSGPIGGRIPRRCSLRRRRRRNRIHSSDRRTTHIRPIITCRTGQPLRSRRRPALARTHRRRGQRTLGLALPRDRRRHRHRRRRGLMTTT